MRVPNSIGSVSLAAVLMLLCSGAGSAQRQAVTLLQTPAPEGASLPNLHADSDTFLLSWVEPAGREHALRLSRFAGGRWGPVQTAGQGADWFVNWADFPSVVSLGSSRMAAHWLKRSSPRHYSYDVRIALSSDAGASWREPIVPHSDSSPTEHGFVSLVPYGRQLAAFWLDGRQLAGGEGAMGLWFASIRPDGRVTAEEQLDGRVCDCCQTAAAPIDDGLIVVYRDRSAAEVRDISAVRLIDGQWESPRPVAGDGWQIRACPVNGPAIAGDGRRRVAVAWFTAGADVARVQVAFSDSAGARFDGPIRLDDGNPLGRVHIVPLDDDDYAVSWLEQRGRGAEIRLRRVGPEGPRGPSLAVARLPGGRATGFPRMVPWTGGVLVAWTRPAARPTSEDSTEEVDPGGIELASVRLGP